MNSNIVWHTQNVTREKRELLNGHKGVCLWFTGLSGSGKSTIANEIQNKLYELKIHTYVLDGDNIRHGLNYDLDFSEKGRKENIRRIGEVTKLFVDAGIIVLTAFISPFKEDREFVRNLLPERRFIEIFIDTELSVCEKRDPKNLYAKAKNNEIKNFTGITSPYEAPENPEIRLDNNDGNLENNVEEIIDYIRHKKFV